MAYLLEIEEKCAEVIRRAIGKNRSLETALDRAFVRIADNPSHFKPLRYPLQNLRRVHILGSFVLIYEILENDGIVRILKFAHHDDAYRHQ